ncbi:MAG: glutamine-synthetase adenylyltransferase, partial [Asticcacaulis sp.]|nr:glutamine-synthetase adenylyltransferase [Asticcacaulis sp.]
MTDVLFSALVDRLHPCGPIINDTAAGYVMEALYEVARAEGWRDVLQQAEAALRPIVAASPYLAGIMKRDPQRLRETLISPPEARLRAILMAAEAIEQQALTVDVADLNASKKILRHLKSECHLLTALADLGDVWSLDHVTAALTRF